MEGENELLCLQTGCGQRICTLEMLQHLYEVDFVNRKLIYLLSSQELLALLDVS